MWTTPAIALATASYLVLARPSVLVFAAPILLLWLVAPRHHLVAEPPLVTPRSTLSHEQQIFLRMLARRTWAFFDTFVGPDDNWLPPDNVQNTARTGGGASHLADQPGDGVARQPGGP